VHEGTQIGQNGDEATCEWVAVSGTLSFSVDDFLAATETSYDDTFVFENGATAPMEVDVVAVGTPSLSRLEALPGFEAGLCDGERYAVDVDVRFFVDGHFDETTTAVAWATLPGRSMWDAFIALDDVLGAATPATLDPAIDGYIELVLTGEMRDGAAEGFAIWQAPDAGDAGRGETIGFWGPYAAYQ